MYVNHEAQFSIEYPAGTISTPVTGAISVRVNSKKSMNECIRQIREIQEALEIGFDQAIEDILKEVK